MIKSMCLQKLGKPVLILHQREYHQVVQHLVFVVDQHSSACLLQTMVLNCHWHADIPFWSVKCSGKWSISWFHHLGLEGSSCLCQILCSNSLRMTCLFHESTPEFHRVPWRRRTFDRLRLFLLSFWWNVVLCESFYEQIFSIWFWHVHKPNIGVLLVGFADPQTVPSIPTTRLAYKNRVWI